MVSPTRSSQINLCRSSTDIDELEAETIMQYEAPLGILKDTNWYNRYPEIGASLCAPRSISSVEVAIVRHFDCPLLLSHVTVGYGTENILEHKRVNVRFWIDSLAI